MRFDTASRRASNPYALLAAKAAKEAYEQYFHHRTGWYSEECPCITQVYYDNNQNCDRDERIGAIIVRKAAEGMPLLARAEYPSEGDSKGYTVALVFYCGMRQATP